MYKNRLKKEKKISNVVHRIDILSEIICTLDHKFPKEENILRLYEETMALKKEVLRDKDEEKIDISQESHTLPSLF